jgi:ATP-dependent DNA helicase RecG
LSLQEEEKLGRTLPLDSLIILSRLRTERRIVTAALAENTQRGETETRASLEKLVESGLVEAHGTGRGRAYTLSFGVYRKAGETIGYIRQVGLKPIQHEQMILNYIEKNGRIKREEVMELCMLTKDQVGNF